MHATLPHAHAKKPQQNVFFGVKTGKTAQRGKMRFTKIDKYAMNKNLKKYKFIQFSP